MKYFFANWKANKNLDEMKKWINNFFSLLDQDASTNEKINQGLIKIIICPPFPLIYPLKEFLQGKKNISLGSQDISKFDQGTYTGEVCAHSLTGLIEYTIIGHSERKQYFNEKDEDIMMKYHFAKKYGIEPVLCLDKPVTTLPDDLRFLCYEPREAISKGDGFGKNQSVTEIIKIKSLIKPSLSIKFIYGGSINKNDIKEYINCSEIDGFLIGGASLDPTHFYTIISAT